MVNRYGFNQLFGTNAQGFIFPLFNTWINEAYYAPYVNIPRGLAFGGVDLYAVQGRDVAAIWDSALNRITISGFF